MPTVLVIEDEPGMVAYLKTELQFENYAVLTAYDGLEGCKYTKTTPKLM